MGLLLGSKFLGYTIFVQSNCWFLEELSNIMLVLKPPETNSCSDVWPLSVFTNLMERPDQGCPAWFPEPKGEPGQKQKLSELTRAISQRMRTSKGLSIDRPKTTVIRQRLPLATWRCCKDRAKEKGCLNNFAAGAVGNWAFQGQVEGRVRRRFGADVLEVWDKACR